MKPGCAAWRRPVASWTGATLSPAVSYVPGISNETSAEWPSFEIVFCAYGERSLATFGVRVEAADDVVDDGAEGRVGRRVSVFDWTMHLLARLDLEAGLVERACGDAALAAAPTRPR